MVLAMIECNLLPANCYLNILSLLSTIYCMNSANRCSAMIIIGVHRRGGGVGVEEMCTAGHSGQRTE